VKKAIVLTVVAILALPLTVISAEEIEARSKIARVTVYPDSALLTREVSLKLNPGEYKVIFPDIIPVIDENSLRVSAAGNAAVKIFGAQLKTEYLETTPSEKIKELQDQIQKLEDDVTRQRDIQRLLQEEKGFLDSIRFFSNTQIPQELVTKMPAPSDLDGTLKFLDAKLRENAILVMESELKIRDLSNKLDALRKELNQISGGVRKLKKSIVVDLEVVKAQSVDLNVSYLVRNVRWQPIYDARADFAKSEVELISYGLVTQKTAEDWTGVEMSLSTARPSIGGNLPYVAAWFLRPFQPRAMEDRLMMKDKGAAMYQRMAFEGEEAMKPPAVSTLMYSSPEEKGTAVVYKLVRKATVKADGSEHKLPISSQILKARFEYSTYPRAITLAYLGSRVKNSPELQLLGGRVNIFLDGDYVGTSNLNNIAPQEEFNLYLGSDENVKVKRELIEKKVVETLVAGIPSPNKHTTFKYKITVENYKSRKITMKLFEAMPVSEEKRIVVKINQVSQEPKKKDWEDRKGVWLWEFELEKGAKQEIVYSFTVEHPREMQVEGL
jgi:uncharacterized protein (TIGR02231 family)